MKKTLLFALSLALAAAFASCAKNDGEGAIRRISGRLNGMPEGRGYTINLVSYINADPEEGGEEILASAPVSANGSFTLNLPKSIRNSDMESVDEVFEQMTYYNGVPFLYDELSITGGNVLMTYPNRLFLEIHQGGELAGDVEYLYSSNSTKVIGLLCYCAGKASATGTYTEYGTTAIADVRLEKGWNWLFDVEVESDENTTKTFTTKTPHGVRLVLDL